jgi:hypothetical protein
MCYVFDPSSDEIASDTDTLSYPEGPELPAARLKCPSNRGQCKEYRQTVFDCDLFYNESTDGLIVEEKQKGLKV